MARDEEQERQAARVGAWVMRLVEGAGPDGMTQAEVERCIAWCEECVLNSILLGWLEQGKVRMRWPSVENSRPDFEARG